MTMKAHLFLDAKVVVAVFIHFFLRRRDAAQASLPVTALTLIHTHDGGHIPLLSLVESTAGAIALLVLLATTQRGCS
jgi:hypothetical protein